MNKEGQALGLDRHSQAEKVDGELCVLGAGGDLSVGAALGGHVLFHAKPTSELLFPAPQTIFQRTERILLFFGKLHIPETNLERPDFVANGGPRVRKRRLC